ncbi:hypothetical protein PHMEG_00019904 [Phytophthora megakarya]|uniref:Ubiquitin-protein ligase E3A N-terminal zinc-binding domain-containing protein n=1 Tax=Phytophthora megakarya TaxID=4795 RepID=A0A225VRZ6_9STRA|nr:hypothetical protein PHMEG_00019904 [Phytophthora megakarya]
MNQDQGENVSGSRNVVATKAEYEYAWQLVHGYFTMLTIGCGRDHCINIHCSSNLQTQTLTPTEAAIKSIYFAVRAPVPFKEELPETSEADILKIQEPESIVIQSIPSVASPRKSTPRRRLSVAVQLDNGLNKSLEQPVKRPTVVTRVAVQPKHKSVDNNVTTVVTKASVIPVQQQENEQAVLACQAPSKSSANDKRKRLVSRPKAKLFDAIRRSFSRSTKKSSLV